MYAPLHVHSCFSCLDGGDTPERMVQRAAELGMPHMALTDHNSTGGVVRFAQACEQYHVTPILGAEVTMADASHLTLLASGPTGFSNLNRLLTASYADGGRLSPGLLWERLEEDTEGVLCLTGCRKGLVASLVREWRYPEAEAVARELQRLFGRENVYIELQEDRTPGAERVAHELWMLGRKIGAPTVATPNAHYATPDGYLTHDLLTCIRHGITFGQVHPNRPFNAERHLLSPSEMTARYEWCPEAIEETIRIAERCAFALPTERITPVRDGDAPAELRARAFAGAADRYPSITPVIRARLEHELSVICALGYPDYVLTCADIVRWTRGQGITCTGRGSAADSCVAFCLRLTDVDVIERRLPFARFLVPGKTPDIDLDFPSSKRDLVFKHVEDEYGADRVAMACAYSTFRARAAVRDVSKVLGLPPDGVKSLSERLHHRVSAGAIEEAFGKSTELNDQGHLIERYKTLFDLCGRISGFPRHHAAHPCGVVISRLPLTCVSPMIPPADGVLRTLLLDGDGCEDVGTVKLDVLALRIHDAMDDAQADSQARRPGFHRSQISDRDGATFAMMQQGRSIGIFQFESPAQQALARRMLPMSFEDLVHAVAMIRPANNTSGAEVLSTVGKYLAARLSHNPISYLHPILEPILNRTYGCIIFQEAVADVVAAVTGWSDAKAEAFRKSLVRHTKNGTLDEAKADFLIAAWSYLPDLTAEAGQTIWDEIKGWGTYGFTEGHAASFARIGYESAWMSAHEAAAFYAGLLSNQPMGFYPPLSLVSEARRRGVRILPIDINLSSGKSTTEQDGTAIRLGLSLVSRLREEEVEAIEAARSSAGPFASLLEMAARVVVRRDAFENLILTGAFDSLHHHRRGLLLKLDETMGLAAEFRSAGFEGQTALAYSSLADTPTPCQDDVPDFSPWSRMMWEWRTSDVIAGPHPLTHLRPQLAKRGVLTVAEAMDLPHKARVTIAGLNIRPHRPPTRSGKKVLFSTIEDESDYAQVTVFGKAIEDTTSTFLLSPAVVVRGTIDRPAKEAGAGLLVEAAWPLRVSR